MKNLFYLSIVLTIALSSGCGKDDTPSNNGSFDNNGITGSNNGSTGNTTNSNNSNNGKTVGTTNASNNTTGGTSTSGTTGTTGTTTGTTKIGVEGYYEGIAKIYCDVSFNCTGRGARQIRQFIGTRFSTQAECDAGLSAYFGSLTFDVLAGETAGRLQTDEVKVSGCFTDLKESLCNGPSQLVQLCDEAITGNVAENGLCVDGAECDGAAYCAKNGSCEGVCTVSVNLCGMEVCGEDEFCDRSTGARICEPKIGNGGECTDRNSCLEGSGCNAALMPGLCQTYGSVLDGEKCDFDQLCSNDSYCKSGICTPINVPKLNEQCDPSFDDCEIGTTCTNVSFVSRLGTCLPSRASAQSCLRTQECEWGLFCDGVDFANDVRGTCKPTGVDGDSCENGDDCQSFTCEANVCASQMVCLP